MGDGEGVARVSRSCTCIMLLWRGRDLYKIVFVICGITFYACRTNSELVNFLKVHRGSNFVKTHGGDIKK